MKFKLDHKVIKQIETLLAKESYAVAAYIFGSYSKGTQSSKSDIDIGVLCLDKSSLNQIETSRDIQHLVNHRLHTAVEICTDIAMNIASALELPGRDSAVDVVALLGKEEIITKDLANRFQKAPKLRNLLIH